MDDLTPEIGRIVNLAQSGDSPAPEQRLQKRLSQSRVPTTQTQSATWVNWNNMSSVLGQPFDTTRIPLSKLEQMRRDSMLAFGLALCKVPLIRAPWYIKSTDAQRAAFIDGALRKIYGRFILAYTNSFDFGYSAIVKRFEYGIPDWTYVNYDDIGTTGDPAAEKDVWPNKDVQALLWKPFMALSPRIAIPHWNADGEFAGIDYSAGGNIGEYGLSGTGGFPWANGSSGISSKAAGRPGDIPLDWALWATNEKDSVFGSLWGYPRLGYAYRYWWSYWYKFGLADRAFEKWADPPVVVHYPADSALDAHGNVVDFAGIALETAELIRSGANVALPSGVIRSDMDRATNTREWEINQLKSEVNFDALNVTFEYLDVQKLRSMMVPEQAVIEGKGGTSSRNVAATMGDLFQESQSVVMQEIDDCINRFLIPQLLEANFGPGGATCTKVTTGFDPQDIETMRLIVTGFANTDPGKLPVDLRELMVRLGIPLLSHTAFQHELDRQAELAAKATPPPIAANKGPGKATAGVTKAGLYETPGEFIDLSHLVEQEDEEEKEPEESEMDRTLGLMERVFQLFRRHEKEIEPQEVKLTFSAEMKDEDELVDG